MTDAEAPIVYVVDDDDAMRDSLAFLIGSVGHDCSCHPSAEDFLARYRPGRPGCLVADIRMPGMSGLDLQRALTERGATLSIIFVTGHGDIPMAVRALRAGAIDFLEKPFNDQTLLDRIGEAVRASREATLRQNRHAEIALRLGGLTPRERAVLEQVAAGKPNKVIAAALGISQKTVEVHRHNVMSKMGVRSAAELARLIAP